MCRCAVEADEIRNNHFGVLRLRFFDVMYKAGSELFSQPCMHVQLFSHKGL